MHPVEYQLHQAGLREIFAADLSNLALHQKEYLSFLYQYLLDNRHLPFDDSQKQHLAAVVRMATEDKISTFSKISRDPKPIKKLVVHLDRLDLEDDPKIVKDLAEKIGFTFIKYDPEVGPVA